MDGTGHRFTKRGSLVVRLGVLASAGLGVASFSGQALGAIGYDNITGNTSLSGFRNDSPGATNPPPDADDTTLNPAFGLEVIAASVLLESDSAFMGVLEVVILADAAGAPGTMLTRGLVTVSLGTLDRRAFRVNFPDFTAPSTTVWTAVGLHRLSGEGYIVFGGTPSVGTSTPRHAGLFSPGQWVVRSTGGAEPFAVRLETVPGPGGLAALAMGVGVTSWRRRRARA